MASILLRPDTLVLISRAVSKELNNTELSDHENTQIIQKVKAIDPNKLRGHSIAAIIEAVAKSIAQDIKVNNKESFSSQLLKKSKVDVTKLFNINDKYKLQRALNPTALYQHDYIVLDTKNRTNYTDGLLKFNWELMENATLANGVVNTAKIKNLVGIRLYPLKFAPYRTFPDNSRYTILIDELASQSFLSNTGKRYHFTLESRLWPFSSVAGQYLELSPRKSNKGYFWFDPPITTLKSFTISMSDNYGVVPLPTAIQTAVFYFTNPMQIAPFLPAPYATGNTIIISGYNLLNPTVPVNAAFIAAVNSAIGYPITIIAPPPGFIGNSIFTIPLDATVIATADRPNYGTVFTTTPTYYNLATTRNDSIGTSIPIELISIKDVSNEDDYS